MTASEPNLVSGLDIKTSPDKSEVKPQTDKPLIYAVDGATLPPPSEKKTGETVVAQASPDQYRPAQHWLGSASTTPASSGEKPKEAVTSADVLGGMVEAGLTTFGASTLIGRGIRTGNNGKWWIFPDKYGIGSHGRDILTRYGNLGAVTSLEPDGNTGRVVPVTKVVRTESLLGAYDPVTGKSVVQIDLGNPSLSLDSMHQAPFQLGLGRQSFYDTFNTPLNGNNFAYQPTPGYLAYHHLAQGDLNDRGILDHVEIVSAELRAHQHATDNARSRGNEVAELVNQRTIFHQELRNVGDQLRTRILGSDDYKEYRRLRTNEDLFERSSIYNGIGDDATIDWAKAARRFAAGSTVMGAESLLYDFKNTGIGIHSIPGLAMESFSAWAWGTAYSVANKDSAWTTLRRGATWGSATGLALAGLGLYEGATEGPNARLTSYLPIPKPTETEAIFLGVGMAIPTKSVAGKFGLIGAAGLLGWGASQVWPDPIDSLLVRPFEK